ncbi:MAG: PHP domain-containing protein [Candidatus Ozemobacter sibiricus]|uniref:PHP domain-containing protein n=1 Tax=Candidatus Ozemobacter sibiricus TaxID=2268124 RepID=A0A367ZU37_9BACT|nr:MAG: PHP domain-containing protein [Candidatus Ozemobacter sibiricus]
MADQRIFADLHVHSTASDGLLSPRELLVRAKEAGLSALGLTDHDTLRGVAEGLAASQELGLPLIPGIELSCGWPDSDVSLHVLGLFVDPTAPALVDLLDRQRRSRHVRALRILDRLEALQIDVAPLRLEFEAQTDRVLGRPHVARFLHAQGHVQEFQEAFTRYLARGKPAYVPKEHVLPIDGVAAIHQAGGVALIAHPGFLPHWKDLWSRVEDLPWDGIEVFYCEHTPQQIDFFTRFARDHGFGCGGGSDYHGEYGKHANRFGLFGVAEEHFRDLERRAAQRRLDRQRN